MSARNFLSSALAAASLALPLHAQAPASASRPSFDVASIKRNMDVPTNSGSMNLPGGRVSITNQRLRQVIRSAYGAVDIEVVGGPDWLDSDRWNILASALSGSPVDAPWREMLKSLLEDRFKLRAHLEQRERPIYAMVFARSDKQLGSKIGPTQCTGQMCGNTSANTQGVAGGTLIGRSRTMEEIGRALSNYAERRVFDRTGLDGRYDFEVTWSPEVSIFTAVQEQLGLKLEAQRAPVDVVVVDSVERASED